MKCLQRAILKISHLIVAIITFVICLILVAIGRYDKKYITKKHFFNRSLFIYSPGWRWMWHGWLGSLISGSNDTVPWPVSSYNKIVGWENIEFDIDDLNNFQGKGCYFQAVASIKIGKGTFIANNVGLITTNHDFSNLEKHTKPLSITIGPQCWIGMNSVILPGVSLGPHTVVAAGAVVTHSFPKGFCVVGGIPATIIKNLKQDDHNDTPPEM